MHELVQLKGAALVEVRLWEVFPTLPWHHLIERDEVLREVVDTLGFQPVTEAEIAEYARLTHNDAAHWRYGEGRRFLMAPIFEDARGMRVTYRGPYPDCGTEGFELGLWRCTPPDPARPERFPQICPHPVQIAYRACAALVAKASQ